MCLHIYGYLFTHTYIHIYMQTDIYIHTHTHIYIYIYISCFLLILNGSSLKLVNMFTYLGSSVSSTETDIDTRLTKAWTAINRLSVIWKSDLTNKMKRSFFQAAIVSILLHGCTTTKRLEKKLDSKYTRMLRAILNRSWRQHSTKQQLYSHNYPSQKLSKLDEPDMLDTARDVGTSS